MIPTVLNCNFSEKGCGKWVKIKFLQYVIDFRNLPGVCVDFIKCFSHRSNQQRGDFDVLMYGGDHPVTTRDSVLIQLNSSIVE